jgi:hypothetical protein
VRLALRVSIEGTGAASEKKTEHDPGRKPAYVRHVGYAALALMTERRGVLAEDLNHNPKSEDYNSRQFNRSKNNS